MTRGGPQKGTLSLQVANAGGAVIVLVKWNRRRNVGIRFPDIKLFFFLANRQSSRSSQKQGNEHYGRVSVFTVAVYYWITEGEG